MFVYDFIEKIGKIEVKHSKKFGKKYVKFAKEFSSEEDYKQNLNEYLKDYRKEIQRLPFNLKTKESREAFLNNIHDEMYHTIKVLQEQFKEITIKSHKCISEQKMRFDCCFPKHFQKKYILKARKEYLVLNSVFDLHLIQIENAIEILNLIALNDGIILKNQKQISGERIKTKLSSQELAFLSFIILQNISEDPNFNRSLLSRILADNFSTKKSIAPKASQLRKHFTDVNDSVRNRIESIINDLSKSFCS